MVAYRNIFKAAWDIARHNPVLWLFAFVVAFIGTSGEVGIVMSAPSLGLNTPDETLGQLIFSAIRDSGFLSGDMMRMVSISIVQKPVLFLMFLVVMTLVVAGLIGLVWLIIVCQGALITAIHRLLDKQPVRWRSAFSAGIQRFWALLALNVGVGIFATLIFGILRVVIFMDFFGAGMVFAVLFILLLLALLSVSFILKFAMFNVVVHSQSLWQAWRRGLEVFRRHWVICAETALFLFVTYVVVTALANYTLSLVFETAIDVLSTVPTAVMLLSVVVFVSLIAIEVVLTAFYWIAWIMVYEMLNSPKMKLVSWVERTVRRTKE